MVHSTSGDSLESIKMGDGTSQRRKPASTIADSRSHSLIVRRVKRLKETTYVIIVDHIILLRGTANAAWRTRQFCAISTSFP